MPHAQTNSSYYRARYYDANSGRFLSEDQDNQGGLYDAANLYVYVENSPTNYVDWYGLYTMKPQNPPLPPPSPALDKLLKCIEAKSGVSLQVTSTSEPPPYSPHGPNDPHRRGDGLAVDIHYPGYPGAVAVLNAAACCGAKFAADENKHPSIHSNAAHMHLQLVPGPSDKNDLPKQPNCWGCI
jgi:RHS repeat-associated protein